jgi:hypothetical protein
VLGAGALAACGGDGGPDTLAEWATEADQVCSSTQAAFDGEPPVVSPFPGEVLRVAAEYSEVLVEQLRDLGTPGERDEDVERYVDTVEARNEALVVYADELDRSPAAGPGPSSDLLSQKTLDAAEQAEALGLQVCRVGVDPTIARTSADTSTTTAPVTGDTARPLDPLDEIVDESETVESSAP